MISSLPPLSLYIHLPWCVKKCPYCDFNSYAARDIPEQAYIKKLLHDLDQDIAQFQLTDRAIHSIFIGGGTPSLFSAKALGNLFAGIKQRLHWPKNLEVTMEANPGTIEHDAFSAYFAIGINRLSVGIQSFNNSHLKKLGRIHSSTEAIKAVQTIREAGFKQFNLDLMHGLPQQHITEALNDLKQAIDLNPTHLSWYQLTIEPNTAFAKTQPILPNENHLIDIETQGKQLLAKWGYHNYEVSAYAKEGSQCQHNLNYWQFGDYLGIGAGAHGKITDINKQTITRTAKLKYPKSYLSQHKLLTHEHQLTNHERSLEFLMNALRLTQGFSRDLWHDHTGLDYSVIQARIDQLIEKKLLVNNHQQIKTTRQGRLFLNHCLLPFL